MKAAKLVRKLKLSDNCVLLIKNSDALATAEIEDIGNAIKALHINAVIMVVDDLDNIRALPQVEMQRYGWYRVEYLMNKVLRKKEEKKDDSGTEPEEQK